MIVPTITSLVAQSGLIPQGTRINVFQTIYWVFLALGTLVGIIVISYMLWNGYKYRHQEGVEDENGDRPKLGEMPSGGGKGRKLFLSFGLSAVIVISLIAWTYGTLLYVEAAPNQPEAQMEGTEVTVIGYQFGWEFEYPNGYTSNGVMRVPVDTRIDIRVTSRDVWHNFGVPALKVKSDAIPGEYTDSWFIAPETGNYTANCYELCGSGHSYMTAKIVVMPQDEYREWYDSQTAAAQNSTDTAAALA